MHKSITKALLEEVKSKEIASKYLAQSKKHARHAQEATLWHNLFKGEEGEIEKRISKKHSALAKAHAMASAACLALHDAHKEP
jgi:hypothetical protein